MAYDMPMQRMHELRRLVANDCIITSDGVYAPNELPEQYTGDLVGLLQVVYAIIHVDIAGRVRYTTYNPPNLLDKEDKVVEILKANINGSVIAVRGSIPREDEEVDPEKSAVQVDLEWVENSNILSDLVTIGSQIWNTLLSQAAEDSWRL